MPTKKNPPKKAAKQKIDTDSLVIRGARVHNLKNVDITIPKHKLTVITGLSGSGKSSLAFDTIFAEGQRRFFESLSGGAKHMFELHDKPDVDEIRGLTPTIAIEQKQVFENPRSTVGTVTEITDYLRLLFARAGIAHCENCNTELIRRTPEEIIEIIFTLAKKEPVTIFAPLIYPGKGAELDFKERLKKAGFSKLRINGTRVTLAEVEADPDHFPITNLDIDMGTIAPDQIKSDMLRVRDVILTALELGDGTVFAVHSTHEEPLSKDLFCPKCHKRVGSFEPNDFSFNSPRGACSACDGLGDRMVIDADLLIPNPRLTLAEGAIRPWVRINTNQSTHLQLLEAVGKKYGFTTTTPFDKIPKKGQDKILFGTGDETYKVGAHAITFLGVIPDLVRRHRETDSDFIRKEIENAMRKVQCPECGGKRLNPRALSVTVAGKTIADVVELTLPEVATFTKSMTATSSNLSATAKAVAKAVTQEILNRLSYLIDVGLDYLTLARSSPTLSGGEGERVRLAMQLGTPLSGVIYVLDEPTVGLHERDTEKLITLLGKLRDNGNTVITVEHDARVMREADYLIDMGPLAGKGGGEIIAAGTPSEVIKKGKGLTAQYLSGKKTIEAPKSMRKGTGKFIEIIGAKAFNLKNVTAKIPLGQFVCVTGVSGSGKSSLILDILANALSHKLYGSKELPAEHKDIKGMENVDKVITVDQSPIGRTPRSNPATYTGIFTVIRDLFTEIPEARLRGFDAGAFSFNVKGGRCENCAGEGYVRIPMQFLPETYVECSECSGTRYRREILDIHYRAMNIAQILDMSVSDASTFFKDVPLLAEKLHVLEEVGLGYMKLGQPAPHLSGGEAQRVKLATELGRRATGKTIYILDEPTTGLHFEDTHHLLKVLHQLVDKGNTVLVIEHNLDVARTADWIIDLGPEGGSKGGEIVGAGTPKDITKIKQSITGQYLKKLL